MNLLKVGSSACAGQMNRRDALVSMAVLLLCSGILVLFTDVEIRLVRWANCNPLVQPVSHGSFSCPDGS